MEELEDYSGEFKPDLELQHFSKNALVRLIRAAGRIYGGIDQLWYGVMRDKFGDQMAGELQTEVWYKRGGAAELEIRSLTKELNFSGNDVANYLKVMQLLPAMATLMEIEFELKNKNHGIMTVKRCRPLEHYEKIEDAVAQKQLCEVLELKGFEYSAKLFNPRMKATPLKLPPRKSKDDIACIWEFKIEPEA